MKGRPGVEEGNEELQNEDDHHISITSHHTKHTQTKWSKYKGIKRSYTVTIKDKHHRYKRRRVG